jgi:Tn3 transposase DDE domain
MSTRSWLVINYIVLWNMVYINAALRQLRAQGHLVLDEDVRHFHLFRRRHLAVTGDYSFLLPKLDGGLRERDRQHPRNALGRGRALAT